MSPQLFEKKILVTGGSGFIGQHLVASLLVGGAQPLVLMRRPNNLSLWAKFASQPRLIQLDLLADNAFEDFLKKERPDVIFHLAGTTNQELCQKVNFQVVKRLLNTIADFGCQRIVLTGSADEYGRQPGAQSENLTLKPQSAYAVSKAQATELALEKAARNNLPITILRLFSVYGAHQPAAMFVASAIKHALDGVSFQMSSGAQKRDLVFVSDVIPAFLAVLQLNSAESGVINIGSGTAIALREVAKLIWQLTAADPKYLKIGARPATSDEAHDTWADVSRAQRLLGWQASTPLISGLTETIKQTASILNSIKSK